MTIRGKWAVALLAALVLSLGVNLFIGGFVGGRALFGWGRPPIERGITRFIDSLPPPAREPVRAAFEAHEDEMKQRFEATREARRALIELMRRPDLTREDLDRGFAALRDRYRDMAEYMNGLVATAVLSLPPQVRAQWKAPDEDDR